MTHQKFDASDYPNVTAIRAANPRVTLGSNWCDPTWYLDGKSHGTNASLRSISWDIVADPGVIDGLKYLVAVLFIGRKGVKKYKSTGIRSFSAGARYMARFMREHSFAEFSQLDAAAFDLFKRRLHQTLSDPAEAEEIEASGPAETVDDVAESETSAKAATTSSMGSGDEEELTLSIAYTRLHIWRLLYDYGDILERAGIPRLSHNPFGGTSPRKMAEALALKGVEAIPPLPDRVARPILELAHRLIQQPADDVIKLQALYLEARAEIGHWPKEEGRDQLQTILAEFPFSPAAPGSEPWQLKLTPAALRQSSGYALARMIDHIRDACFLVILSDTGVRISEACSLEVEDREINEDLPACIEVRSSKSELNEHFFMKGWLAKNREESEPEEWLVGARPVGAVGEPPTVRAIRVLERLFQPWRRYSEDPHVRRQLIVGFRAPALPKYPSSIGPIDGTTLRLSMKSFVKETCDLDTRLAPFLDQEPELAPYISSKGACVRPHQWRKTFLLWLMRIDDTLLPAISQHFKHFTLAITENNYMPRDQGLLEAADSVRTREVARYIWERRHGTKRSVSRLDPIVQKGLQEVEEIIGGRDFAEAEPDLAKYVSDHDLSIWFARHGRCMIGLHPEQARCHSEGGTADYRNRSPNLITRQPSLCLGCINFSAGPESLPFWRERYVTNQTAWVQSGYQRSYRTMRARAKQSAAVLRSLGATLPEIRVKPPRGVKLPDGEKEY